MLDTKRTNQRTSVHTRLTLLPNAHNINNHQRSRLALYIHILVFFYTYMYACEVIVFVCACNFAVERLWLVGLRLFALVFLLNTRCTPLHSLCHCKYEQKMKFYDFSFGSIFSAPCHFLSQFLALFLIRTARLYCSTEQHFFFDCCWWCLHATTLLCFVFCFYVNRIYLYSISTVTLLHVCYALVIMVIKFSL